MAQQNKQSQFQQPSPRTTIISVVLFMLCLLYTSFLGDAASTRVKIERARAALSATPRRTEPPYEMGFCFGIAEADPEAPLELYEVLALADRRMYEEKRRFHIDRNINALIRCV